MNLNTTEGIVLYRQKYSDTSQIVRIYTLKYGKQAYIVFNSTKKSNSSKKNLLQPLHILDMNVYHKPDGMLQKIKDFSSALVLHSLPFSPVKTAVSFFIAEMIDFSLKENQPDAETYAFLRQAVELYDLTPADFNDFHVAFLINFSKYLGFFPKNNASEIRKNFDLISGQFITGIPNHRHFLNEQQSFLIQKTLQTPFSLFTNLKFNANERAELTEILIRYFVLHLEKSDYPKTLDILHDVFSK